MAYNNLPFMSKNSISTLLSYFSKAFKYKMSAESFNWYKHRLWSLIGFFIFPLCFFILLIPHLGPLPIINLQHSMDAGLTVQGIENSNTSQPSSAEVIERKPICNVSDPKYDFCDVEGDIRIHGKSSKIFVVSSQTDNLLGNESWTVKPYPRKKDQYMMGMIKEFSVVVTLGHEEEALPCSLNHSVPAIVFSVGGYAGTNYWHAFTDILVPLFAASAQFHGEVQFLVANFDERWIMKYQAILKQLSRYEIINIDAEDNVHCFPYLMVGLKHFKELRVDPLTASKGYSMKEFRKLIRNAYSLKKSTAIKTCPDSEKKPRVMILSRNDTRKFLNIKEIAELAKSMGFEVVIAEAMADLDKFSHIVNSCDVMVGIHGAGLTNLVFLPSNAIVIQVLPWGGFFEWLASNCFGDPALDMGLRYMEYRIKEEESSLIEQYPLDHPVFKDTESIHKGDWVVFKSVYLDKQDLKLNISRFKATLLEALELLHLDCVH